MLQILEKKLVQNIIFDCDVMNEISNEFFVEINCQIIGVFRKLQLIFCAIFEYQLIAIDIFQSLSLTDKVWYVAIKLVALFAGNVKRAVKTTL